ncbi:MAG: hypothetical protein Sylvanvirus6_33 [Sylvanvirus sp.]|uniref:Uncharacterized protein n=1 Tax=Sylvanvirus sp. TaxID=2487774 RepID=A0A3G5AHL2_9VIRU|nr:MAG: hypothetical protein Sylvanvirus6_33 [Sylvanvirus sp.]
MNEIEQWKSMRRPATPPTAMTRDQLQDTIEKTKSGVKQMFARTLMGDQKAKDMWKNGVYPQVQELLNMGKTNQHMGQLKSIVLNMMDDPERLIDDIFTLLLQGLSSKEVTITIKNLWSMVKQFNSEELQRIQQE